MKSKTLSTIANLLSSLQKRITKTSAVAHQNAGSILILADKQKEVEAAVEVFRAQSFQRSDAIALSLAQVKEENDRRETHQTLRDQNNVQSLVNLRDSTGKAFSQVKTDVQNLIDTNSRLSTRLYKVEASYDDLLERAKAVIRTHVIPQPAPASMPSDHVWVNKKLTGVYDSLDEIQGEFEKIRQAAISAGSHEGSKWAIRKLEDTDNQILKAVANAELRLQQLEQGAPAAVPQSTILDRNRSKILSAEGFCTDTACKQQQFAKHYFGPGCRFYETSSW